MKDLPKDLAKALDLAAELQQERDFAPHEITSYAQQMANALHKHRAQIEALPELVASLGEVAHWLEAAGTYSVELGEKPTVALERARAALANATGAT